MKVEKQQQKASLLENEIRPFSKKLYIIYFTQKKFANYLLGNYLYTLRFPHANFRFHIFMRFWDARKTFQSYIRNLKFASNVSSNKFINWKLPISCDLKLKFVSRAEVKDSEKFLILFLVSWDNTVFFWVFLITFRRWRLMKWKKLVMRD